jgi:molecular chaperone GrpE (heat shock protein)
MRFLPFWGSTTTNRSACRQHAGVADQASSEPATDFSVRLDALVAEVARLGREQFRATTLLEGFRSHLEEISDVQQQQGGRQQRDLAELRQAQTGLADETRLQLLTELLPVADGLHSSIRAGRDLLAAVREAEHERTESPARRGAWSLRRLFGAQDPLVLVTDHGPAVDAWLDGLVLLERRLLAVFERHGVRPVPAIGEPFSPYRHLAVGTRIEDAVAENTVVAEELTGYAAGDRVLRHAEVVVARNSRQREPDVHKEAS